MTAPGARPGSRGRVWLAAALLAGAAVLGAGVRPVAGIAPPAPGTLERGLPMRVGAWQAIADTLPQVDLTLPADGTRRNDRPYDAVVMRSYADASGRRVMLAVAYAAQQRQEVKIHRPDLCYPSQGFALRASAPAWPPGLRDAQGPLEARRLLTARGPVHEAVLYLLRTDRDYGQAPWDGRLAILRAGLQGRVPDGALVRVSMRLTPADAGPAVFETLERFMVELLAGTAPDARERLVPGWRGD